jgi:CubicO group peptidase (beta-lactamase class C family)
VCLVQASKCALPQPDDVLELAAPKCFLDEGSSSAPFKDGDKTVHPKQLSEAIQKVMRAQLQAGTQVGMQVSVYYKGRQVANVCGGVYRSMSEGGDTWKAVDPSTLFMSYSVCKGVAAAGLMTCVDRGECKYDDRVSEKWSAFAQGDKAAVTIADAVSHRAGMPGITMRFLPVVAAHVAAAARGWKSAWCAGTAFIENYRPEWTPGTGALYHYVSFSWIIGGIVERVSGLHIHRLVLDRVAAPLNQQGNMYVGLLPGSEQDRAARLEVPHAYTPLPAGWGSPDELASDAEEQAGGSSALESQEHAAGSAGALLRKRFFGWIESSIFVGAGNSWAWRQVCLPSSNGFFTAGALGCMYGALS